MGAIAGIAAGAAIFVVLVLGAVGISVYVCRRMDRELKHAKRDVKPTTSFSTSRSEGVKSEEGQDGAAIEMPC